MCGTAEVGSAFEVRLSCASSLDSVLAGVFKQSKVGTNASMVAVLALSLMSHQRDACLAVMWPFWLAEMFASLSVCRLSLA